MLDIYKKLSNDAINLSLNIPLLQESLFEPILGHENNNIKQMENFVNIKSTDIFYEIKENNNKIEKKEEKIIIITTESMENNLNSENINNFFIDVTYKVIPKKCHNYKLLTISGIDNNNNSTYLCALILNKKIKFHLLKYLNI